MKLLPIFLLLLLCTTALPSAAQSASVVQASFDLYERPGRVYDFSTCEGGAFTFLDRGFRFAEGTQQEGTSGLGCGEAVRRISLPADGGKLELRFDATRQVGRDATSIGGVNNFRQSVELRDVNGAVLVQVPFFADAADASEAMPVHLGPFDLPSGAGAIDVAWRFEDLGTELAPGAPVLDLGESYSSTISDITLVHRDIPIPDLTIDASRDRTGTFQVRETTFTITVPNALYDAYGIGFHVRGPVGMEFSRLRGPLGQELAAGPEAIEQEAVAFEARSDRVLITTAPHLTGAGGPGTYTLVLQEVLDLETSPWLLPFATAMLVTPLPFAVAAIVRVSAFSREAFGHYKRSAVRLRLAVAFAVAYYLAVSLSAYVGGRIELMATLPLRAEAGLLYLQVGIAIAAFATLWRVARELYSITQPEPRRLAEVESSQRGD